MCGIIGYLSKNIAIDRDLFNAMRDCLAHRGPDGFGSWFHNDKCIALGHRRLSFLDLTETGVQPLHNEDKSVWASINGEIYNYIELREELQKAGHIFRSSGDSEVIVHAYEEWGVDMLSRLDGMFAFALWDNNASVMFLARDRFGIKPLYYYADGERFIFSSEPKAILHDPSVPREIDYTSMCDFFHYRYIPSPRTIYRNMFKLQPGHYMLLDNTNSAEQKCYFRPIAENTKQSLSKTAKHIDELLLEAVTKHVRSDVPLGSFLSGGYDSTALVKYFSRIKKGFNTFSIGFDGWEHSEHLFAEQVSNVYATSQHHTVLNSKSIDELPEIMYYFDEPIADISIIPTFCVSKLAAQHNKAVLSGEGADELFAGYTWHRKYLWDIDNKWLKKAKRYGWDIPVNHFDVSSYSKAMAMGHFGRNELESLLMPNYHKYIPDDSDWFYRLHCNKELPIPKRFQMLDLRTFMSELVLVKIDRASMAHSLETRVPFLANDVVEYMLCLAPLSYFDGKRQKPVLRKILKKDIPKSILNRKKQGFTGPDEYYQNPEFYSNTLLNSSLVDRGIVNRKYVDACIENHDYWRLWKIAVFELWFRNWINK